MGVSHRFSTPFGFVWSLTFFGVTDGFSYSLLRTSLYAILSDCPVYVAGHDHMIGSIPVRLKSDELLNSTGTTEGFLAIKNKLEIEASGFKSKLSNGIYIDNKKYTLFASLPCAGACYEGFRQLFNYNYEQLNDIFHMLKNEYIKNTIIKEVNFFLPHLRGNGSPEKNIFAKGLYYGFTDCISSKQVLFDISVGLCLELKNLYDCFDPNNDKFSVIKVIGPAIKNEFWLQLKADVLNKKIIAIDIPEMVSYGAACYFENCNAKMDRMKEYTPDKIKTLFFSKLYDKYKKIYNKKISMEKQNIYNNESVTNSV